MMTVVGIIVKVITHGLANVPEPVTAVVAIPALVSAVLRFVELMFQARGAVVREVNREQESPTNGGANINVIGGG